jgi:hypothetical protein
MSYHNKNPLERGRLVQSEHHYYLIECVLVMTKLANNHPLVIKSAICFFEKACDIIRAHIELRELIIS